MSDVIGGLLGMLSNAMAGSASAELPVNDLQREIEANRKAAEAERAAIRARFAPPAPTRTVEQIVADTVKRTVGDGAKQDAKARETPTIEERLRESRAKLEVLGRQVEAFGASSAAKEAGELDGIRAAARDDARLKFKNRLYRAERKRTLKKLMKGR